MKKKIASIVLTSIADMCGKINDVVIDAPRGGCVSCTGCPGGCECAVVAETVAPPVAETVAPPVAETVAPPVAETVAPPVADVDSVGCPWDARIHSSGKTTYAKSGGDDKPAGGWVLKKGVDTAEVRRIKAEIMAPPVTETMAPPVTEIMAPPVAETMAPPVAETPVTAPPVAETIVENYDALPDYGAIATWGKLMEAVIRAGLDVDVADTHANLVGGGSLAELQNHATLIPAVAASLGLTKKQ